MSLNLDRALPRLIKVLNLLPAIAGAPTKVTASAVAGLVNDKLAETFARYLDRNSPSHQELGDLAQHKWAIPRIVIFLAIER